jgi:hypothetical protein
LSSKISLSLSLAGDIIYVCIQFDDGKNLETRKKIDSPKICLQKLLLDGLRKLDGGVGRYCIFAVLNR